MGKLLIFVGGLWALIGVGNVVMMDWGAGSDTTVQTLGVILNGVLFVMPGLVVLGIGAMLDRKKREED
jgi:hypothetical protein